MVATAFVSQMDTEAETLRKAKSEMENALAGGLDLRGPRIELDRANDHYKVASTQIRKHAVAPKQAKAKGKASAKAKAAAAGPTA